MKGAMVILAAMIVIGVILYLTDVFYYRKKHPEADGKPSEAEEKDGADDVRGDAEPSVSAKVSVPANPTDEPEVCCGTHMVCEKTNLSPITGEIVYYDDEELDRFRGRQADEYSSEEIEEFRDVLMTLQPQDVAGWSRSIQVREITLPTEIREELLLIVSELRRLS